MDFEEVTKSLWHAFDVLDDSAQVKKSRVRVLTNNLGHVMGVEQAETIWDKVNENLIDFDTFVSVLRTSLLVGIEKNTNPRMALLRAQLDNLCWMLCEKTYVQRVRSCVLTDGKENTRIHEFSSSDLFKLWKIFNFLSERAEDGFVLVPLRLDVEEADRIAVEICSVLGLPVPNKKKKNSSTGSGDASFLLDFCDFANHLARKLGTEEPPNVISHGIAEIHDQTISDIVRKGYMVKFGNKVTSWKDRWFVLSASDLKYYMSSEQKYLKGSIALCAECFTQSFPDKPGGKHHRLKLHTPTKQYELCAPDLKSKNEWMSDMRRVVNHMLVNKGSLQSQAWKERKKSREEKRRRTAEEELRRCAEREKLEERERQLEEERKQRELAQAEIREQEKLLGLERQKRLEEEELRQKEMNRLLEEKKLEIDAERQRCAETELRLKAEREELVKMNQEALEAEREERSLVIEHLKGEEAILEREKQSLIERLKELEETKASLEALVEEERALKRDEEIVRTLQSRILDEEFAKREELERLQEEQRKQLVEEKLSRQELLEAHKRQEEELGLKQEQLMALVVEREQADQNWQDAIDKLKQAEVERQKVEERLKLKEMNSSVGLAKPLSASDPNPFITHRGLGAFSESDFQRQSPDHFRSSEDELSDDPEMEANICCMSDQVAAVGLNGNA